MGMGDDHVKFDVPGAGDLFISKSCDWKTGGAHGFSISVSWGKHGGQYGGVIDKEEALALANHIINIIYENDKR